MTRSAMTYYLPAVALAAVSMSSTTAFTIIPTRTTRSPTFLNNYDPNTGTQEIIPAADNSNSNSNSMHDKSENREGTTTVEEIKENYIVSDRDAEVNTNTPKADVFKAFRKDEVTGEAVGDEVVIKLSKNHQGMERESQNYDALDSDLFVEKHEFYEPAEEGDASAMVLEAAETDLTRYINANIPLSTEDLKQKAKGVVDILVELHEKNVVWTEVKTCNFVVLADNGEVRGIDLESATYVGTPNIMHTAAGTPPEFAVEHLAGRNANMELSFDIWSLGMVLYQLAVGENYFAPRFELTDFEGIFTFLKENEELDFTKLNATATDPRLKELIISCLAFDPAARPTIQQIREHPFFAQG